MVSSIRLRLQLWYAVVLVAVIGGFAGALYYQARAGRLRDVDTQLQSSATNLSTALVGMPPHRRPPRDRGEFRPGERPPPRDFGDRGPPNRDFVDGPGPPRGDGPQGPPEANRPGPDGPRPERLRPERRAPGDMPGPPGPPGPPPGMNMPPEERLEVAFSLGTRGRQEPQYFAVWSADGQLLASSLESPPEPGDRPGFRWEPPDRREWLTVGPHGELVLVGKSAGRELAELRTLAWQLAASGLAVLVVGLAGGWLISRSITRPIAAISRTASEISATNLARRIDTVGIDSELVGLATVLNQMFARLEASFERQSRFTSDASHELRTPLAVIHAHAELALSKSRSADEYRETLVACLKATSRMATLVDGLLTLARADAGRLDVHFATVDLRAVVAEVVDQYQPQAASSGIALSADLDEPAPVRGDPALLARVSSNLLSNALRYTPEGGRVRVSLRAAGSAALLVVEDSGCGIPPEDQSKVFERFFRADKARSRAQGGNGLGLAICKTLVDVHQGTIGFTSVPERGTRFEVRLPLVAPPGLPAPLPAIDSPPSPN
jgi:heavy metal sensor kinase